MMLFLLMWMVVLIAMHIVVKPSQDKKLIARGDNKPDAGGQDLVLSDAHKTANRFDKVTESFSYNAHVSFQCLYGRL